MAVPTRLKALREASGLSQQAVASKVGVSDTSYQHYEYGTRDIPGNVLVKFSELYSVPTDYILCVIDDIPDDYLTVNEKELLFLFKRTSDDGKRQILEHARYISATCKPKSDRHNTADSKSA